MKKIALFTMAAITFAACSNEDDFQSTTPNIPGQLSENKTILVPEQTNETRNSATPDFVNVWQVGDQVGVSVVRDSAGTITTIENGLYTGTNITYHGRNLVGFKTTSNVGWLDGISNHDFYMYFPYVDAATVDHENVPYTLSDTQTASALSLFMWGKSTKRIRPADNAVPFSAKRLLPLVRFNIIRDDASLDGYTLNNVVVKPTTGTMPTGTTTFNLTNIDESSTPTISFSGTTSQYKVNASLNVNDIPMNNSKSVYMTVPPAASREYTITATFTKAAAETKTLSVTRTDAFTSSYGEGSVTEYSFNTSKLNAITGSSEVGYSHDFGTFILAESNLVYIDGEYRFAKSLTECMPDETLTTAKTWEAAGSKHCYWQFAWLSVSGTYNAGFNFGAGASCIGWTDWPGDYDHDPCRHVVGGEWYLPSATQLQVVSNYLSANGKTVRISQNGHTYLGQLAGNGTTTILEGDIFMPYSGYRDPATGNVQFTWSTDWIPGANYWTSSWATSAVEYNVETGQTLVVRGDIGSQTTYIDRNSWQRTGNVIRCVKNK